MKHTPEILRTKIVHYAALPLVVPRDQIARVMGPGVQEIHAALVAQQIQPTGPWFTHHFKRPDTEFDFEICVPVATAPAPSGRVEPGVWPPMRVARTVYSGDYSGLGSAWAELDAWIGEQGLRPAKDLWEVYLISPDASRNPADWRTELSRPLLD